MAFEFASTNLVVELGILMALVLGWQFTLGEFVGGPLMIVLLALVFRLFLKRGLVEEAREQAERGALGRMEGHAEMDMSVQRTGSMWRRLRSPEGWSVDFGISDDDELVHSTASELSQRLPASDRPHWAQHLVTPATSRNFLTMRLSPGSCIDDGELRDWPG